MSANPEPRPAKRAKVEDDDVHAVAALTRSDVWYKDGSVVLRAGSSIFRVHQGVLSGHSAVLRDTFAVADVSADTIEGCPVLRLEDDSAELRHVLKALYGDQSYFSPDIPMEFQVLAGFLNLGTKYRLPHLRKEAIARLRQEYPCTLEGFTDYQKQHRLRTARITPRYGIDKDLVNLVRKHQMPIFLPIMFVGITERAAAYIVKHEDGATGLTYDDQIRCLEFKERDAFFRAEHKYNWANAVVPDCERHGDCRTSRLMAFVPVGIANIGIRVLGPWDEYMTKSVECRNCNAASNAAFKKYLTEWWEALPGMAGLPPWAELRTGEGV